MQHNFRFFLFLSVVTALTPAFATPVAPIRISVTAFENKSATSYQDDGCYGWHWFRADLGSAFQERLLAEVGKNSRLEVFERAALGTVYDQEIDLKNAEKTEPIERGQFQRAQYTLVGAVTAFEYCKGGGEASIDVGSLLGIGSFGIGGNLSKATVEVAVRVIDTRTGKIMKTAHGAGKEKTTSGGLFASIQTVDFRTKAFSDSILGHAIDKAVEAAASEISQWFADR